MIALFWFLPLILFVAFYVMRVVQRRRRERALRRAVLAALTEEWRSQE